MSEIEWIVDRAKLYSLREKRPQAKPKQLAQELGRSERWARKWLKRFAHHEGDEKTLFCSRSRARHKANKKVCPEVVEAILDIRDNRAEGLNRTPGPRTILYYLPRHEEIKEKSYYLPKSTSTIWAILNENGRIYRRQRQPAQPEPPSEPMADWQMDFKTVSTVPAEENGKKQHVVETLNIVDKGTSIVVGSVPRGDYHAQTTLITLVDLFLQQGLPQTLTIDRDPRFVGAWTAKKFPSALMRFWLCVGVMPIVCPARRPQKNAFVERFNGSYKRECLLIHQPTTLAETIQYTNQYLYHYNYERPHQGRSCQNKPPRLVFPDAQAARHLPSQVDPDAWLDYASRRLYARTVSSGGSLQIGGKRYYIAKSLAHQKVAVGVNRQEKTLAFYQAKTCVKTKKMRGLYQGKLPFADYIEIMLEEVWSESRRRDVKRRYQQPLSH